MRILQTLQYFGQVYRASRQPLPHPEEYTRLAEDAHDACSEWFGPPDDLEMPVYLHVSPDDGGQCARRRDEYRIYLSQDLDSPELRCQVIGHEMYHRVTSHRDGTRRECWIDEIMAHIAARWFLERHGHTAYLATDERRYVTCKDRVDLDALRTFVRPTPLIRTRSHSTYYPENFYRDIRRVSVGLSHIVNKRALARLPLSDSLGSWLETLTAESRHCVCRLLELPGADDETRDRGEWNVKMGLAFQAVGRYDEAVAELRVRQRKGCSPTSLIFNIALCLETAGHLNKARDTYLDNKARDTYLDVVRHNPTHASAAHNLANIYRKQEDFASALFWYQEALRRKPDWSSALYYLGMTYAEDGQQEKALACWQRVVSLSDPLHTRPAREAIAEHKAGTPYMVYSR